MQFSKRLLVPFLAFTLLSACGKNNQTQDGTIAVIDGEHHVIRDDLEAKKACETHFCEPNYIVYASFGSKRSGARILNPYPITPSPEANPAPTQPPSISPVAQKPGNSNAGSYAGEILNTKLAWSKTVGKKEVIVAIIDSGMDVTHPDLKDHLAANIDTGTGYDFTTNTANPIDEAGHGTHVAGIISSVAPNVSLLPLKFMGADGAGSTADAIRAINYAVEHGAKVINASWGSTSYSALLQQAITYAIQSGVTFVAAAGNEGANFDFTPNYPAAFPGVISVAASNETDYIANYSNYGNTVTISAPGDKIMSTYPGGGYQTLSGTSMASPQVAGTIALMKSQSSKLGEPEVTEALCKTAKSWLPGATRCGRMDTGRAVTEI